MAKYRYIWKQTLLLDSSRVSILSREFLLWKIPIASPFPWKILCEYTCPDMYPRNNIDEAYMSDLYEFY